MDFDDAREANIAKNKLLLLELGLKETNIVVVPRKQQQAKGTKRKAPAKPESDGEDEDTKPARKVPAVQVASGDGPRRSGRNAGKVTNYAGDGDGLRRDDGPKILTAQARRAAEKEPMGVQNRTYDPKTFGSIPNVPVGTWWETRKECSIAAIHAPWVAGISGGPDGCYSVALSGGYEDDVDLGEGFTYTGSGGRDLKGTKHNPKNLRTAPQSYDQTFDTKDNRALLKSVETRKPVRVIRGYKLHSRYAPAEGYRYDGLYTVEKAWQEKGLNPKGYLVCKFAFKRLPNQPPLPVYADEGEEVDDAVERAAESSEAELKEEDSDEEKSETAVASEPEISEVKADMEVDKYQLGGQDIKAAIVPASEVDELKA
ncbi:hypothetical protein BDW22DRAFT_47112 [Trametopsis cervina]|nr:hypothetical protein BDW22DRAFT_47112 [Trametopsis cervina]